MKVKKNTSRYKTTMLTRLLIPMIFVFVIQSSVMIFMFLNSGLLNKSDDSAYIEFSEKVLSRKIYIENEKFKRWTAFQGINEEILSVIINVLNEEGLSQKEIINRDDVQNKIMEDIIPMLIYLLRKNNVMGIFLVLDSPRSLSESGTDFSYPGIYLRNPSLLLSPAENNDLRLLHGNPETVEQYKIALDDEYKKYFSISNRLNDENSKYFNYPIRLAKLGINASTEQMSYWSPPFNLCEKEEVITYSIPLKDDDGNIYGVLGIDLSINYLKSFLYFDELYSGRKGLYCIATRDTSVDSLEFTPICVSGTSVDLTASQFPVLNVVKTGYKNVYRIENSMFLGSKQCVAVEKFNMYPPKSFYGNQEWVLMGIVPENDILSFSSTLIGIFWQTLFIAGILFLTGAYLSSKHISNMLARVVSKIENSDQTKPLHLEKMNIVELDSLISSIENLSIGVFNAASRVSKIVEQLQVPIGVFEHNIILGTVFCNSIWFKLFNIRKYSTDTVLNDAEFYQMLNELEYYINSKEGTKTIYAIPTGEPGKVRWIRFTGMKENERVMGIALDITRENEDRTRLEMQMNYDDLTGLYNRNAFDRKISEVFKQRHIGICALVMWDIDNLKYLNDSFGHAYGDAHLQIFGKKLSTLQQDRCIVCRRSGDEFYTFFYSFSTADEIRLLLNAFWKEIQEMTIVLPSGEETRLRVSGGIAWYPYDADNQADLIRYADFAIYDVKHSFKGSLHDFNLDMYKKNYILIQGTEALNKMFEKNLIEYAMQPIIVAATGEIYGYEMLMRSMMSEFKSPEDILRLARAQSKLHILEEITFFAAMETFTEKIKSGEISKTSKVFLNTVSSQILTETKITEFEDRFTPYLSNIVLEITESEPLNTAFYSIKSDLIQKWNAMIAIDDFGSGYSNDSSLVFLSPNLVKIDISIVREIHKSLDKQNLLENLISYAKKRDIIVLAEGVETIEEIKVLLGFGVDLFQGYFFAKPSFTIEPIPPEKLQALRDAYIDKI
ncbi:bifunctional diguanylate cyclase/phosphodiesterase [Treponema pedis]|uniref:bifunctional diguanylate cyclase/phosphodiesterase n=1 Tax=Treponema pedis TaxID=409322 RepID=UPI00040E372A|nr:EAL domain-containing protein [Treponema pedis]